MLAASSYDKELGQSKKNVLAASSYDKELGQSKKKVEQGMWMKREMMLRILSLNSGSSRRWSRKQDFF